MAGHGEHSGEAWLLPPTQSGVHPAGLASGQDREVIAEVPPGPARPEGQEGKRGSQGWEGGPDRSPALSSRLSHQRGGGEVRRRKSLPEPFLPILKSTQDSQGPHQGPALDLHFRTAVYNTCVVRTPRGGALVSCKWGAESLGLPGRQQRGCPGQREHDGPVVFACRH